MKRVDKNIKLSNKLLLNYIIIIALVGFLSLAIFIGYIMYNFFEDVPLVIWDNEEYNIITQENSELSKIIEHGGFYEVIDDDMAIIYEENSTYKEGYEYSIVELFKVIITGKRKKFDVVMKFDLQTDNIVIIGLPSDVKNVAFTNQKLDSAGVKILIKRIVIILLIIFVVMSILIYSKITSKTFVKPIMDLLKSFEKMKDGDYSARIAVNDNVKELIEVKNAFNHMAEKIQMENNLKNKSEKKRKQMILDISHDLKNPLTSIQGYSEFLIKNDKLNREKNLEILKIINKNSIRANHLIDELFQYSKLQSEKYKLKIKKGDICEFLREIIASYIPRIEQMNFEYETNISDREIFINFDEKEMDRAISNILDNSLKYNEEGTTITIKTIDMKDCVKIVIKDDGVGIPFELQNTIFEPFIRGDESRNSNTGGTGLGLAIAENIIKRHKGTITLNSINRGSEFIIKLPK